MIDFEQRIKETSIDNWDDCGAFVISKERWDIVKIVYETLCRSKDPNIYHTAVSCSNEAIYLRFVKLKQIDHPKEFVPEILDIEFNINGSIYWIRSDTKAETCTDVNTLPELLNDF